MPWVQLLERNGQNVGRTAFYINEIIDVSGVQIRFIALLVAFFTIPLSFRVLILQTRIS